MSILHIRRKAFSTTIPAVSIIGNCFKNFNFAFIDKEVSKLLRNLYFTEDEIEEMDARTSTEIALLDEKRQKGFDQIERKRKKIREDLSYLHANKISLLKSGVYTPEGYVAEEAQLETQLTALKGSEDISDEAMRETMKDIEKL